MAFSITLCRTCASGGIAVGKLKELPLFGSDYSTPDGTGARDDIHIVDLWTRVSRGARRNTMLG